MMNNQYKNVQTAAILKTDGVDGIDDVNNDTIVHVEASVATDGKEFLSPTPIQAMDLDIGGNTIVKGVMQEPEFRDKWFGVAFLAHLGIVVSITCMYATGILETTVPLGSDRRGLRFLQDFQDDEDDEIFSEKALIHIVLVLVISLVTAPVLALLAIKKMETSGVPLIRGSIYFAIGLNLFLGVVFSTGIFHLIVAAILACYAKAIWHRIPFAAANLKAAVTCVQANHGMIVLAVTNVPFFCVWAIMWLYLFISSMKSPWMTAQETDIAVTDDFNGVSNSHQETSFTLQGQAAIAALLLSFYWTCQVMKNIVHTSLAGTVGTWWFLPHEANGCYSRGLRDSLSRSMTYSFGSICFGSLIVAILEVIRNMFQSATRNRRGGILRLIAQCLLVWIERIAEYFNRWAFVYVGLYGYSYMEAGKNVVTLFQERGWSTIISDALVARMLGMMCLCIGLVNAIVSAVLALGTGEAGIIASAYFGFIIGILISSMVFRVVMSAVDSIIVLFAEAPAEFKENHPGLCQELEDTWTQAWPDVFSTGNGNSAVATQVV